MEIANWLMSLWWHGLHCRIPVEPPFIICERKQNNLSYLKVLLVNNCPLSRLVTKYNNVLLQFTTARLITNYDNVSLQFTITWLLQLSAIVITIYDDCYYNYDRCYNSRHYYNSSQQILCKHEFKDIFQENDWCFTGNKKKKKKNQFKSHLKNRCPSKPIRQLVCKVGRKHVFSYFDFCSYLKANDPDRFHFLLKVLLPAKFIAKSNNRLPKRPLKKPSLCSTIDFFYQIIFDDR